MKKRFFAAALALALTLSLAPSALALGAFTDVTDAETARDVEVLRLMGVVEGSGGSFRPNASLTRAEFCKMAVVLTGRRAVAARYGSRTVFPDVKASHWASGYVNCAASADVGMIHGLPDGSFAPDRAITYGEAAAILTRLLGYTDTDSGGIWPDGYLALADAAGMTKGVSASGGSAITRAQAAKLFVNALTAANDSGATLAAKLGYTLSAETVLYSVDLAGGKLRTREKDYPMANPMTSTLLGGAKGRVVANAAGEALTFLPSTGTAGGVVADAAIIVSANGSTAGFDAITGGAANYTLYRNGVRASAAALKRNDVATYNAASNTVQVCDTRVLVYYEGCTPSQTAPASLTALGGTMFDVLPTAQQSLAQFRPGQTIVLLLTADGRVASAAANNGSSVNGNAFAYIDDSGAASLICGGSLFPLTLDDSKTTVDTSKVRGEAVRISQSGGNGRSTVYLAKQSSGASGVLNLTTMTLGTRAVAPDALVFSDGALTSLAALGETRVEQSRIAYARVGTAGKVDLLVIKDSKNELYGRVTVRVDSGSAIQTITVVYGTEHTTDTRQSGYAVRTGDFVSFGYTGDRSNFYNMVPLARLTAVPASAWIGNAAVVYGGQTYTVPASVICYNRDGGVWFDDLAAAKAYGGTMDLFVKNGVVRAVEVHG